MDFKKRLRSALNIDEMKTKVLFFILLSTAVLVSCSKTRNAETQTKDDCTNVLHQPSATVDTTALLDDALPSAVDSTAVLEEASSSSSRHANSSSCSSGYSNSYADDADDYEDELSSTSSNDNYLLGFDDDVDDEHDMEIYMEDY